MNSQTAKTTGSPPWVASLYDSYVFTADDIPFFVQEAEAAKGPVLELMAGTGRVSIPLAEAGVDLTCVDLSGPMLGRLSEKLTHNGLSANVVEADVCGMDLDHLNYALAMLPFQSFAELPDPDAQRQALNQVARHLKPGGRFICTHHNAALRAPAIDGILHLRGEFPENGSDRTIKLWTCEKREEGSALVTALQVFEMFSSDGNREEERRFEVNYRLVEVDEFRQMAEAAGFRVIDLYGDYQRGPFWTEESIYAIWMLERS